MKNNLFKSLMIPLALICQLWSIISCDQAINSFSNNNYNNLIGRAQQNLKAHPDSSILLADSARKITDLKNLPGGSLYVLNKIKADAFESLGLTDSAYLCIEKVWLTSYLYVDTLSHARSAELLGAYNLKRNNYHIAEKFLMEASDLYTILRMDFHKAKTESNYSVVLTYKGENAKSQQHLLSAYQIFSKLDSLSDLSIVCNNIGNNYADLENYAQARKYYIEAYKVSEISRNFTTQTRAMLNLGTLYRVAYPDSALYYSHITDSLLNKYPNPLINLKLKYNIANVYSEKGDLEKAMLIYGEVLVYCEKNKFASGISRALNGLSTVYERKNDLDKAILFKSRALQLADSIGEAVLVTTLTEELARVYKEKGDFKKAINLYQRSKAINDSIRKVDNSSVSRELELLTEVQQKENESERLNMELRTTQNTLRLRHVYIITLSCFIMILGLLLNWSFRLNKERARAYSVLMEKFISEKVLKDQMGSPLTEKCIVADDPHMTDVLFLDTVISYYNDEKPYLDPKLKIDTVADKLNTNPKVIAQTLKMYNNSNFNKFTNFFRVEEAKQLLSEEKYKNYKIEAIAVEVGFGTTRSFYNSFEQFTGIKPAFFRNYLIQKQNENLTSNITA